MRVLLVGEYSGLSINLKHGLRAAGISCDLAADGDSWKKLEGADIPLSKPYTSRLGQIRSVIFDPLISLNKLKGYDVVQLVDPAVFSRHINLTVFDYLKKNNGKVFVSMAGDSCSLFDAYKAGAFDYYIYDDNPEHVAKFSSSTRKGRQKKKQEDYILDRVDGIIPIMYEYAVGVRHRPNCCKTIPIPFDSTKVEYTPNIIKNRVVFLHGLLREKVKGSNYIIEALNKLKNKYPNDVEVIVDGRMPLSDYLLLLQKVNVLVDQCKENCWGMNACYGMASGRIVMGGATEKSLMELGLTSSPVINICPDSKQIYQELERLMDVRKDFLELGKQSRDFVSHFHNHVDIAKRYIETWNNNI